METIVSLTKFSTEDGLIVMPTFKLEVLASGWQVHGTYSGLREHNSGVEHIYTINPVGLTLDTTIQHF